MKKHVLKKNVKSLSRGVVILFLLFIIAIQVNGQNQIVFSAKSSVNSGYLTKWKNIAAAIDTINNSLIYDNGTNIGIGTTNPAGIFHTYASGAKTASYSGNILTNGATSSTASITKSGLEVISTGTWNGSGAANIGLYVSTVSGGTNNYDAIFNGGGNVGIGTTSPTAILHTMAYGTKTTNYTGNILSNVALSTTASITKVGLEITSTGTWSGASAKNIGLYVSNVGGGTNNYDAIFNGGGNVGIGTTSPTALFHTVASGVMNAAYSGNILSNIATSSTASITKAGLEVISTGTWNGSGAKNIGLYVSSVSGAATGNNYDAIFNGGGIVGIGTLAPNAGFLHINNAASISATIHFTNSTTGSTSTDGVNVGAQGTMMLFETRETKVDGSAFEFRNVDGETLFRINSLAEVGVNTSTHGSKFQVKGSGSTNSTSSLNIMNSGSNSLLFVRDDGNVGIGTTTPSQKLEIYHNDATGGIVINRGAGTSSKSEIKFSKTGHEKWAIGNDFFNNGENTFFIWDQTDSIHSFAALLIDNMGRVGLGYTPPANGTYRLYVQGGIVALDVKVTAGTFPDYVFEKNYNLPSIYELENYINNNKHLPGIPSAIEIEKNEGFEVGDMQKKLIKVVEEQALYIIDLQKQLDEVKKRLENLENN
jgi:hypothetical protein